MKILAEGPSAVYARVFEHPPVLAWDGLTLDFPSLTIEAQAAEARSGPEIRVLEIATDELARWIPHFWASGGVGGDELEVLNDAVLRRIPVISAVLLSQLLRIQPSRDGELEYRPCTVA